MNIDKMNEWQVGVFLYMEKLMNVCIRTLYLKFESLCFFS